MLKDSGLTPEEKQQFANDGFFVVRDLLPREDIQALVDDLEAQAERGVRAAVEARILDSADCFEDAPFETRLAMVSDACTDKGWIWHEFFSVQKIRTPGMFTLRTSKPLLDVVESLIGPEIYAHPQYSFRAKMPDQHITVIPWHQDLAYLNPEEAGDTLVVNAWIPLVDATVENGCMQVIRGSHQFDLIPHDHREEAPDHKGRRGIVEASLPDGDVFTAELAVGDAMLTTERLVHCSLPNVSNTVRWSVDTRYCRTGLPTGRESVPGFIARSEDPSTVTPDLLAWNRLLEEGA